ncbi:MAG: hypothetical protein AABX04_07445 [Nanoarchaeota archaeon]
MNHLKVGGITIVAILTVSLFAALFFIDRSSGEAVKMLPAYDTRCIDSDKGLNFTEKGMTKGIYQSKFAVKADSCVNSSHLMEYYCSRNKVQSITKNCGEMGNYGCEGGKCASCPKGSFKMDNNSCSPNGIPFYFIENYGPLNCSKNLNFCASFNSAKRYYGFGTYNLSAGGYVIIPPFILKNYIDQFTNKLYTNVLWTNKKGNLLLIDWLQINASSTFGILVQGNNEIVTFTNDCQDFLNKCEINNIPLNFCQKWCFWEQQANEVTFQTKNVTGFAEKDLEKFNEYLVKSFQNCYEKDTHFLNISLPYITYVKISKVDQGGGCSSGTFVHCNNNLDFINNYVFSEHLDKFIDAGECLNFDAQSHELVHWLIHATPISDSGVLNEGLAKYTETNITNVTFGGSHLKCLENGYQSWWVEGGWEPIHLYTNLSAFDHSAEADFTAACVWDYIVNTYGYDKFVQIMKANAALRYVPGNYQVFKDIINPILGKDILPELNEKFNLQEMTVGVWM